MSALYLLFVCHFFSFSFMTRAKPKSFQTSEFKIYWHIRNITNIVTVAVTPLCSPSLRLKANHTFRSEDLSFETVIYPRWHQGTFVTSTAWNCWRHYIPNVLHLGTFKESFLCSLELEMTSPYAPTSHLTDVTTRYNNSIAVQSCPPSHESYCLYQGVCFYFPEMESYACK